jgi:DNA-binding NarL/FixJ family response regulator
MAKRIIIQNSTGTQEWLAPISCNFNHLLGDSRQIVRLALVSGDGATIELTQRATRTRARGWPLRIHATVQALASQPPPLCHVLLLDLLPTWRDGVNELQLLLQAAPTLPVVVLCPPLGREPLFQSMSAGASGCIIKPSSPDEVACVIMRARAGLPALCSQAKRLLSSSRLTPCNPAFDLTENEQEFLALAATGLSLKDIADAMGTSERTPENYRNSIFRKLDVHKLSDAIRLYFENQQD